MSFADLVRAVVAVYPPESSLESRTGGLAGEPTRSKPQRQHSITAGTQVERVCLLLLPPRLDLEYAIPRILQDSKFLKAFDIDNDGISYSEYLLLSAFLKFPAQASQIYVQLLLDTFLLLDEQRAKV